MRKINELRLRFLCRFIEDHVKSFGILSVEKTGNRLSDRAVSFLYGKKIADVKDGEIRSALTSNVVDFVLEHHLLSSRILSGGFSSFAGQKVVSAINTFFLAKAERALPQKEMDNFKNEIQNRLTINTKQR